MESTILEIMHRHVNDQQHVPFTAAFASTPSFKRPSRPSSRASTHFFHLESNSPASSPRTISFVHVSTARRPHTPVTSSPFHIDATATAVNPSIPQASSPANLHASIASLTRTSPTSSPLLAPLPQCEAVLGLAPPPTCTPSPVPSRTPPATHSLSLR